METTVTRHSYFRGPHRTERHTEHAPPRPPESPHDVCCCTREVAERPPGEPTSVSQTVTFTEAVGEYRMRLDLTATRPRATPEEALAAYQHSNNAPHFRVTWPRSRPPGAYSWQQGDERADFHFLRPDHLQVSVSGTGDGGDVDCASGRVLFGNEVDVSTFMNGHSPSRVVDLKVLHPDDAWTHFGMQGHEAWARLSSAREVERLRHLQYLARKIQKEVTPLNVVYPDVRAIRSGATATQTDRWWVADCFGLLENLLRGFQTSALRQDLLRVYEEVVRKMKEERA